MMVGPPQVSAALAAAGIHPIGQAVLAASGWESHIFRCETERGVLAVRVHARTDPEPADREAAAMSELARLGYPVPPVHGRLEVAGHPALVMRFVDGGTLWEPHLGLSRADVATTCRRLLDDLHALEVGAESDPLGWFRAGTARIAAAMPRFQPHVERLWQELPGDVTAVWCHLDLHPGNILWDGVPWVVDWTSARVTDPRFDVLWTRLLAEMYAPDMAPLFATEQPEPWFEAACALRRLATVAMMLAGTDHAAGDALEDHMDAMQVPADWLARSTGIPIPDVEALLHRPTG